MNIQFTDTVLVAQSVLSLLITMVKAKGDKTSEPMGMMIEHYQNGREHGFTVINYPNYVTFSQNRNSNDIVVYIGNTANQGLSDNITDRKYFDYNQPYQAAEYCLEQLLKPVSKV